MSITSSPDGGLRAAAGARDPVEFHDVAGARLAVARRGRGPLVVCLHATGHGARDYESFADRVGDAFEVVALDWPGQGRSPREVTPASASRYAGLLTGLLETLGGPAIVIGCSIGGAAAIEAAAKRPDLVRALVVCNTGGLVAIDAPSRFAIGLMQRFFAAGANGARWYPKAFEIYYRMVLPGAPARAQRERIVAAAVETAPVLAEAWGSFASPQADLRALARTLRCPTLFAWAAKDRILPWSKSRAAAETVPDHRVEMFDGGHAAFLEDPERFAGIFRGFAAGLAATG